LIGPEHLTKYVARAHTRICYSSVSPLQEAAAVGYEKAGELNFWEHSVSEMLARMKKFNEVWDELGIPVRLASLISPAHLGYAIDFVVQHFPYPFIHDIRVSGLSLTLTNLLFPPNP
jgi:hypothetical protein